MSGSRCVKTTTSIAPVALIPRVTKRCSPNESRVFARCAVSPCQSLGLGHDCIGVEQRRLAPFISRHPAPNLLAPRLLDDRVGRDFERFQKQVHQALPVLGLPHGCHCAPVRRDHCGTRVHPQCLHLRASRNTSSLQSGQRTCVSGVGAFGSFRRFGKTRRRISPRTGEKNIEMRVQPKKLRPRELAAIPTTTLKINHPRKISIALVV